MNYNVSQVRKNVYLVLADTQYAICSIFVRPQEFYESPLTGIQGNFFTLENFMDLYAESRYHKGFSYFEDWAGFNIPGHVLKNFYSMFNHDFSNKENLLFTCIDSYRKYLTPEEEIKPYYVIGAYGKKIDKSVLDHEISHAYWYLYPEYLDEMKSNLKKISSDTKDAIIGKLLAMGYDSATMDDEICAYLATSKRESIIRRFDFPKNFRIPSSFRKTFKKFNLKYI
jgi:hypothetical protein